MRLHLLSLCLPGSTFTHGLAFGDKSVTVMIGTPLRADPHHHHAPASSEAVLLPRGTHLLYVGDSLLRYEYLAMAILHRFQGIDHDARAKATELLWRRMDFSWDEYLNMTNRMLQPNEFCDCYRNASASINIENRFFSDPSHDVHITFLTFEGSHYSTMSGVWWPGSPDSRRQPHATLPERTSTWQLSASNLDRFVALLSPPVTHVVVNQGHHLKLPLPFKGYATLLESLRRALRSNATEDARIWWSTTTACPAALGFDKETQVIKGRNWSWVGNVSDECHEEGGHLSDMACRWQLHGVPNAYCLRSMARWNASNEVKKAALAGFCVFDSHAATADLQPSDFMDGLHLAPRPLKQLMRQRMHTIFGPGASEACMAMGAAQMHASL